MNSTLLALKTSAKNKRPTAQAALVLGLVLHVCMAAAQNLATNPGFETGDTRGWFPFGSPTIIGSPTISAQTNQVHQGSYAALVTNRILAWMGIGQGFQRVLQTNQPYRFSAWLRLASGTNQAMQLTLQKNDGKGLSYAVIANGSVSANGWTQLSGQYTHHYSGALSWLLFYAEVPSSSNTAFYIDDLVVQPVAGGTTNPVVSGNTNTADLYPPARRLLPAAWKASWAADSKRLTFTRQGGGISVLELESGQVTGLTSSGKDPAWSPDGKFIAYVPGTGVGDNTPAEEVWIIPAKGGEPVKLAHGGFPAWTPDSKRVLFHSRSSSPYKILSVGLDAPQEQPTVFFAKPDSLYPAVSADNARVAFHGEGKLTVYDTKTGELIASLPAPYSGLPGWSPDGRQVAFGGYGRFPGLWIFDVERGGAYLAATNGTMPAWSPDGKRLVFDVRETGGGKSWELWVIETASLPRNPVLTNQLPSPQPVGQRTGEPEQSATSLVGKPAPTFTLPLLDGGDFDLASHQNKHIVLLDFWATWCGPCRAVMPALAEISRDYADKGVKYFAVNLWEDSTKIRSYLEGAKLDIAVPLDKDGSIANKYGVRGIPTMVIVGKDGKVKKVHVGSSPNLKTELTRSLDNLLAGKEASAGEPTQPSPSAPVPPQPGHTVYSQNIVSYGSPPGPAEASSRKADLSDKAAAQIVSEFYHNARANQYLRNLGLFVSPDTQVVGISKGRGRENIWRKTAKEFVELSAGDDHSTDMLAATRVQMVEETLAVVEAAYCNQYIKGPAVFTLTAEGGSWRIASLVLDSTFHDDF